MGASMGYAPVGMFAWDFWLIEREGVHYLFHLQAPRGLHPALIHQHATVGLATSSDLRTWTPRGTVLEPGPKGAWDDRCIWTGSVLEHQGRYAMLYTGRSRKEFLVQRIGVAFSDDLLTWTKHPANPVLTADPRWYETRRDGWLGIEDWRDPYMLQDDLSNPGRVIALITARTRAPQPASRLAVSLSHVRELAGAADLPGFGPAGLPARIPLTGRGCVARANSYDLVDWTVEAPLFAPATYGALECPQLFTEGGYEFLLASTLRGWVRRGVRPGSPQTGVLAFSRRAGTHDAFQPATPRGGLLFGTRSGLYATKVVRTGDGRLLALSWLRSRPGSGAHIFVGTIDQPIPLIADRGQLRIGAR